MDIQSYFQEAVKREASDVHLVVGSVPAIRLTGELVKLSEEKVEQAALEAWLKTIVDAKVLDNFQSKREADFSINLFDVRFRVNLHFQRERIGLSARLIKKQIPTPQDIGLSESLEKMVRLRDGLILVTGPTGSGKSTTLASMIDAISQNRTSHIITIEDPIEYMFADNKSIVEQREVGNDTETFSSALKYVLRQDPNVIMVGEMRDMETMSTVLMAAETGHLVLSTLHTTTAIETISRIVDSFPTHQQGQVLLQLAFTLRAVIAQQLLPRSDGGMVAAREVLINNQAVANLIRRNQINQLQTVIQTSQQEGMVDMNRAIENLFTRGYISAETARNRQRDESSKATYY